MVHGFSLVILIGVVALGALRLLAGKRGAAPRTAPRRAVDKAVGRSVHHAPGSARPARAVTVVTEDIRSVTPEKAYLLSNARPSGPSDATTALLNIMSGPGLCTPRTEDSY